MQKRNTCVRKIGQNQLVQIVVLLIATELVVAIINVLPGISRGKVKFVLAAVEWNALHY